MIASYFATVVLVLETDLDNPGQHLDRFQNLWSLSETRSGGNAQGKKLTLRGTLRSSMEKGVLMMKFLLSLTTGPTFTFPILSVGSCDPRGIRFR